jgi:hypothetical protein
MRRPLFLGAGVTALWWILAVVPWYDFGIDSLTGTQLYPQLQILASITLITVFISAYYRKARWVLGLGVLASGFVSFLLLTTNPKLQNAFGDLIARLTAQVSVDPSATTYDYSSTIWPQTTMALAVVATMLLTWALFAKWQPRNKKSGSTQLDPQDPKSLWDEQEN